MKQTLACICFLVGFCAAKAQSTLVKKDTIWGRAGQWKDSKNFIANDGTVFTRAAKAGAKTMMGFDIQLPPNNQWTQQQKKADENEQQFKTDIEKEIAQSPELKYWGKELTAAIKVAEGYVDAVRGKAAESPMPLSDQQTGWSMPPAAGEKNAALEIMSQWAKEHCDEIHKTAALLDKVKGNGKKTYVENYTVAPQPPQYDLLDVCNQCHPQVRRDFEAECTQYAEDYFFKYLKEPMDALVFVLRAQQQYALAHADGFSTKEIEGEPCLLELDRSRIILTDFSQVNDVAAALGDITYKKFFREYKDNEKMHVPLLMVILKIEQQVSLLGSRGTPYWDEEMEGINKQLEKILDAWKTRLKAGDVRMLTAYTGVLEVQMQRSLLGFSNNSNVDGEMDLIGKNIVAKINLEADTKITGETEQKNYQLAHVKGEGYMGIKVDSIRCMWMEPVENNNGQFTSLVKGGIKMKVISGEVFARGDEKNPDTRSKFRSPMDYDITPRIHFDICNERDNKHVLIFDFLGPDPSRYVEWWTGADKPVRGALNAPFMLAFKSEDYTVDKSETKDEVEDLKDSLELNKTKDVTELQKAAADFQAHKISYQQFMAIQKKVTEKVLGNVEKLKEEVVYVKVPVDLSPEKGFFINQRIDAKSINPGKKEIVYGYLTIQLKPNK